MICPQCNNHYEDGKFCPDCGVPLIEETPQQNASGVSLNLGDANAISGGVHLADSHDVHNIQNTSNTTVDNSHTVNNSTIYEAQKTQAEIQLENENLFLQAVQERFSDGLLDQRELAELNQLCLKWRIPSQRANQIIEQVRSSAQILQGNTGIDFLAQQTLDEVYDAIKNNHVEVLKKRLSALEQIARSTSDGDVQFYYHLLLASLTPETSAISFLNARTDNYWQLFWVHVAYIKLGQIDNATVLLPRMGGFGAPQGDMLLLMAIDNLAEYRKSPQHDYYIIQAQDKLMQAQQLGLSEPLSALWYAVKEAMMEEQKPEEWFQFYVEQTVKELCPKKASAKPKDPLQMPKMEVPPVPKFNAQNVNLAQMQGFNPLQAAQKMGLGMAGGIEKIGMSSQTMSDETAPPPFPSSNISDLSPVNAESQEQEATDKE